MSSDLSPLQGRVTTAYRSISSVVNGTKNLSSTELLRFLSLPFQTFLFHSLPCLFQCSLLEFRCSGAFQLPAAHLVIILNPTLLIHQVLCWDPLQRRPSHCGHCRKSEDSRKQLVMASSPLLNSYLFENFCTTSTSSFKNQPSIMWSRTELFLVLRISQPFFAAALEGQGGSQSEQHGYTLSGVMKTDLKFVATSGRVKFLSAV